MNIINELLQKHKKAHFSLIDPDNQNPEDAGEVARICEESGTHAIMIGGSTVRSRRLVYDTMEAVKKNVRLPIILFPNSSESISENIEHLLFMTLLNSKDIRYRFDEQAKGALLVKKWGINTIPTGYVVVSTSKNPTTIEQNVKLDKIYINDLDEAVEYAIYAELIGLKCIYFDAGSGAEQPISNEMIRRIRSNINIPLIIGGGIRDGDTAKQKIDAGADIIVNGTVVEQDITIIKDIVKKIQDSYLNMVDYTI